METCYMCCEPATSKEHVPPKCLFPESKDLEPGVDLRKRLITVPSCDLHNSGKSKDDEYLLLGLTMNILNNGVALSHFQTKILRAITRSPSLVAGFAKTQQPVIAVKQDGTAIRTLMVSVDNQRFLGSLDHIAKGLYFHKFGHRHLGRCSILPDFMLFGDGLKGVTLNDRNNQVVSLVRPAFDSLSEEGENPEIFRYAFMLPDTQGRVAARMKFFDGSAVYVTYVPAEI